MYLDRIIAVRNDKTVYRDDDLCLKVFGEEYTKAHVLSEALNLARAEEAGLNVPHLLRVEEIEGRWTLATRYVPGKTLAQLMRENPKRRAVYLSSLADWQLSLQAKPCPHFPRLHDKLSRALDEAGLPSEVRHALQVRLESLPEYRQLCHGDFEPSNLLLTEDGSPCILDWPHAAEGNACADAARTYLLLWLSGDIDGEEKYLSLYCEKSGTEKRRILQWMPLIAAARLRKCRAAEREFLRSWIDEGGTL